MHTGNNRVSAPDWALLPSEILQLIAGNLIDIIDYSCFRCVCSSWRIAVVPTDLRPQVPWMAITFSKNTFVDEVSFFLPSDRWRHVYSIKLNNTNASPEFIGSSHGWLVIVNLLPPYSQYRRRVSLLHPITKAQILLPEIPMLKNRFYRIVGAVLCSNPASAQRGKLLVALFTSLGLVLLRQGDQAWTMIHNLIIKDILYYNDELYLVNNLGGVAVLEAGSLTLKQLSHQVPLEWVEPENIHRCHLVEVAGDLLLLMWYDFLCIHTNLFIFKLGRRQIGELNWSRIGIIDYPPPWSRWTIESVCAEGLPDRRGYKIYLAHTYVDELGKLVPVDKIIDVVDDDVTNTVEQTYFHQVESTEKRILRDVFLITPTLH